MQSIGNILIADDEDTFRRSTAYLLQEQGYACDCASDGAEALQLFHRNSYDLLVAYFPSHKADLEVATYDPVNGSKTQWAKTKAHWNKVLR